MECVTCKALFLCLLLLPCLAVLIANPQDSAQDVIHSGMAVAKIAEVLVAWAADDQEIPGDLPGELAAPSGCWVLGLSGLLSCGGENYFASMVPAWHGWVAFRQV